MAIRSNHYDAAFEEYLRSRRVPYVAVDEKRRALFADQSLKSLDFIVETPGRNLLVDVKGRRFGGTAGRWENWATEDDVTSMKRWEGVFGDRFQAALVFTYWLDESVIDIPDGFESFTFAGRRYLFAAASLDDYAAACHTRSASWGTVAVARATFRSFHVPLHRLLDGSYEAEASPDDAAASRSTNA